MIAHM